MGFRSYFKLLMQESLVWVTEISKPAARNLKLCYLHALLYWNTWNKSLFCEYLFVTRNCTPCLKHNAVLQGCPVTVLNEEMTLGKLLARKKVTEPRNVGAKYLRSMYMGKTGWRIEKWGREVIKTSLYVGSIGRDKTLAKARNQDPERELKIRTNM